MIKNAANWEFHRCGKTDEQIEESFYEMERYVGNIKKRNIEDKKHQALLKSMCSGVLTENLDISKLEENIKTHDDCDNASARP